MLLTTTSHIQGKEIEEPLYKLSHKFSESLILAQSERWRRG